MHKRYRTGALVTHALRGVDLDVEEGEFVSIVGPSGSGKTTLLHTIGGLDRNYEGTVEVHGRELGSMSDVELSDYRNKTVGFVFQAFYLLPHLSCAENVALPSLFARNAGAPPSRADVHERAKAALARVELADKIDAPPTTLSGGQRQRVAVARALFNRPSLMLCDEPTGNLDQKMSATIIDLFREVHASDGITIMLVTHDPKIAAATDRQIVVEDGRIADDSSMPSSAAQPEAPA